GSQETVDALLGHVTEIVRFGLPDDYFQTYAQKVRSVSREQVMAVAEKVVQPDKLIWVVVGDRSKIEQGIRELGIGEISVLDADGKPVQ
ncbi:MAG: insulinase family protein, partial [Bryobacteraceae bacterium]|nr:insulinase family protein [Bryobacteraceae bacterium]